MSSLNQTLPKRNLRYVFRDIVRGFSQGKWGESVAYIKHLSALDQVELEEIDTSYFEQAKNKGVPTRKEALDRLKEEELWVTEDENALTEHRSYLEGLSKTRKQLYLKSDITKNEDQTKEGEQKLFVLESKKEELIGNTCEKYARNRVNDFYIIKSFYRDEQLKNPLFSEKSIDEISQSELVGIVTQYNEKVATIGDLAVQQLVLEDFYSAYFPFADSVMNFYNKPLFELSSLQVKLIVFTRMFKNIFETHPKIPDAIKKDPEKIIDYVNAQDKAKEMINNLDKEGASTVMGATKEDYEYLGQKENLQGRSLSDMLKAKGGRMDMKDLMETMA